MRSTPPKTSTSIGPTSFEQIEKLEKELGDHETQLVAAAVAAEKLKRKIAYLAVRIEEYQPQIDKIIKESCVDLHTHHNWVVTGYSSNCRYEELKCTICQKER